jgi:hypothetical protein
MNANFSFIETNGAVSNSYAYGLISINDIRSGYSKNANPDNMPSIVENSLFWNKKSGALAYAMTHGSKVTFTDSTIGKNGNFNPQWGTNPMGSTNLTYQNCRSDSLGINGVGQVTEYDVTKFLKGFYTRKNWLERTCLAEFMRERRTYHSYGYTGNQGISKEGVDPIAYLQDHFKP